MSRRKESTILVCHQEVGRPRRGWVAGFGLGVSLTANGGEVDVVTSGTLGANTNNVTVATSATLAVGNTETIGQLSTSGTVTVNAAAGLTASLVTTSAGTVTIDGSLAAGNVINTG